MSQFFISGGQSIGASASASVLPMNIQGWFPLGLTGLISLQSKGLSRNIYNHQKFHLYSSPHLVTFFFLVITFKIFQIYNILKNCFQIYNAILLTIVAILYITSTGITYLITGILYLWTLSPFPPLPSPRLCNHQSALSLWGGFSRSHV